MMVEAKARAPCACFERYAPRAFRKPIARPVYLHPQGFELELTCVKATVSPAVTIMAVATIILVRVDSPACFLPSAGMLVSPIVVCTTAGGAGLGWPISSLPLTSTI